MSRQFYATKNMMKSAIGYTRPLSYDEWLDSPYKVEVLFVQFFPQILLAWNKLYTKAAVEEECVEEVIQYLIKNVYDFPMRAKGPLPEFSKEHTRITEKRFTPNYIYQVAYNAIYCKSIDPYKGQTARNSWYNNVQSNIIVVDSDDLDIYELYPVNSVTSGNVIHPFEMDNEIRPLKGMKQFPDGTKVKIESPSLSDKFWYILENQKDPDTGKDLTLDQVIRYITATNKTEKSTKVVKHIRTQILATFCLRDLGSLCSGLDNRILDVINKCAEI